MKTPKRLIPLVQNGTIDDVVCQLMSGKEATVFVVRTNDDLRCAKVYKESQQRSFKTNVQYREGRHVRNSRRARAMKRKSSYGRQELEKSWQTAEVENLSRLTAANIKVPKVYSFQDGILIMELIKDTQGQAAPRLNDVSLSEDMAISLHQRILSEIVNMLCIGMIHGDLSEYNILLGKDGPIIIDVPQAIFAASNNNAYTILEKDIKNMTSYFGQFAPKLLTTNYEQEIWHLFKKGQLTPKTKLTGRYQDQRHNLNRRQVDALVQHLREEEAEQKLKKRSV